MGDQGTWILLPHDSELRWLARRTRVPTETGQPRVSPPTQVVAWNPATRTAVTETGEYVDLDRGEGIAMIERGSSYISAAPGWRKGIFWGDPDSGECGVTWAAVVAWQVGDFGVRGGASTHSEFGVEPSFELNDHPYTAYWHTSEGEDRKVELEGELREEAQRSMTPPPAPPSSAPSEGADA